MTFREAIVSLAVAGAAGGIIGVEREQSQQAREGVEFGGIRTFPLVALFGALGALLLPIAGVWVLIVELAALGGLLAVAHVRTAGADVGISTEIAALLAFVLGAIAATPDFMPTNERYLFVAATSAIVMTLLALKRPLHGFAAKISRDDMYATTRFVLLALVVLPLLPNRTYGPFDVLNPYKVGLMIALVAGISFAGYVASRVQGGDRGLLVAGLLGGLVSSTAVTMTFSSRSKEAVKALPLFAVGILAASATMFPRIILIVLVADAPLAARIALPLGTMAVIAYAMAWVAYRRETKRSVGSDVPLRNPFEMRQAIQFGLLYGVILFVAKAAGSYLGSAGVYASSVLAGLADVDAITLSLTELHRGGLSPATAAGGITVAAVTNTIVKVVLAFALGGAALGRRVAVPMLVSVAVGLATIAVMNVALR